MRDSLKRLRSGGRPGRGDPAGMSCAAPAETDSSSRRSVGVGVERGLVDAERDPERRALVGLALDVDAAGERLDESQALLCFTTPHVLHLGRLANAVRERRHGNTAYFNVNRHINPTNVCVYTYDCKFCSFAALPGEDHAWKMTHEEVYELAAKQGGSRSRYSPRRRFRC